MVAKDDESDRKRANPGSAIDSAKRHGSNDLRKPGPQPFEMTAISMVETTFRSEFAWK